jgi:AcrR family transcriptional regulator
LTRDRVLRAAIDLADDEGIDSVTMRRLGQALGVEAMSLYNHVARFLAEFPVDEHPYLVEHVHQHLKERNPEDEDEFAFGLDLILDGLERIRDTA